MVRGKLIFISGGARSGKSRYAEKMMTTLKGEQKRLVYIASGQATDDEMKERIERHQLDRAKLNWNTIERPTDLSKVVPFIKQHDLILWDCMTTWLANELYEGWEMNKACLHQPNCMEEKEDKLFQTIEAIQRTADLFVVVSNEVFHELPSAYEETEIYRQWLGHLHQKVVQKADVAIEMEAGIPIFWKGEHTI